MAVVNIFFGKETVMGEENIQIQMDKLSTELERSIRIGPVDFVASLGGLFGLCLGFSIISFLEIVYWAAIGFFRNVFNK